MTKKYNIVLTGDSGAGKSTWLYMLRNNSFLKKHTPTIGVEVFPIVFALENGGKLCFNIWDCAGKLRTEMNYYSIADAVIVMYNDKSGESKENVALWANETSSKTPIVICENKMQGKTISDIGTGTNLKIKNNKSAFCSISIKNKSNILKPLIEAYNLIEKNNRI